MGRKKGPKNDERKGGKSPLRLSPSLLLHVRAKEREQSVVVITGFVARAIFAQNNKGSISLSQRSVSRSVSSPRLSSRAVRSLARASRSISRKAAVSSSRVLRRPSKRLLLVVVSERVRASI